MEKESFKKSIYTLETLATEMFWRDKNGVPAEQVYWNRGLWAEQERLRKALDYEIDKTLAEIQRILGINVNVDEL